MSPAEAHGARSRVTSGAHRLDPRKTLQRRIPMKMVETTRGTRAAPGTCRARHTAPVKMLFFAMWPITVGVASLLTRLLNGRRAARTFAGVPLRTGLGGRRPASIDAARTVPVVTGEM